MSKNKNTKKIKLGLRFRFILLFAGGSVLPLIIISFFLKYKPVFFLENDPFFFLVFIFTVTIVGAIFLGIIATKHIVSPIEKMHKATLEYKKGNFDYRVKEDAKDELGELARTLNEMAQRIKEMYEREKNISGMKSEFISIAAHQMRTPLAAIKWTLNILSTGSMGPLNTKQKEALRQGNEVAEHMIRLINDLLNISRIEDGRFGYNFKKHSIIDLMEDLLKEEKIKADQNDVGLEFKKPKEKLPNISMDFEKLRMAIANFIDNAIKYSLPGKVVRVGITTRGNEIIVWVKDEGIGIPKKQLKRLFTKFFRAENAIRLQTSGSGLGLYIAKNIIKKHKGRVWAESEQNKGSIFFFSLPIQPEKKIDNAGDKEFREIIKDL